MGLGLAMSYSIVKKHGGLIKLRSHPGEGTVFTILLPASEQVPPEPLEEEKKVVPGKGRVLLMDDDPGVTLTTMALVRFLGYQVEAASDGQAGLDLYERAADAGKGFDVVIMDLTVPGGMGGREMITRLLQMDPKAKSIVASGYCDDPVMANYRDYGFLGVLTKPYSMEELGQTLERAICWDGLDPSSSE